MLSWKYLTTSIKIGEFSSSTYWLPPAINNKSYLARSTSFLLNRGKDKLIPYLPEISLYFKEKISTSNLALLKRATVPIASKSSNFINLLYQFYLF